VPWKLTIRAGSRVEHRRFDGLEEALAAIEARGRELEQTAPRDSVDVRVKRFDPVQQVVARIELSGPERLVARVNAGVDVRGDGSTEAYLGRVRRKLIEPRGDETAYSALRRAISAG
jgi:hypothetical protein